MFEWIVSIGLLVVPLYFIIKLLKALRRIREEKELAMRPVVYITNSNIQQNKDDNKDTKAIVDMVKKKSFDKGYRAAFEDMGN